MDSDGQIFEQGRQGLADRHVVCRPAQIGDVPDVARQVTDRTRGRVAGREIVRDQGTADRVHRTEQTCRPATPGFLVRLSGDARHVYPKRAPRLR